MPEIALTDPVAWGNFFIMIASHPMFGVVVFGVVLYIVLNSKAFTAWCSRRKRD